jgi:hypothetical protein
LLLALSWFGLPTASASATLNGIAKGLGAGALDPPSPSKRYKDKIKLPRRLDSKIEDHLAPLGEVLTECSLFSRLDKHLYAIERRYLGALQAEDSAAAKMQSESYAEATREMQLTATKLSIAVDKAQTWLRSVGALELAKANKILTEWSRNGIRSGRGPDGQALFDKETVRFINAAARSPGFMAAAMGGLEPNLVKLRASILSVAAYAARDRLRFSKSQHKWPRQRSRGGVRATKR